MSDRNAGEDGANGSLLRALSLVRDIPDFPQPGIVFKDITPLLQSPDAFAEVVAAIAAHARILRPDIVVGVESRGFVFGAPVALAIGAGFVPVRKKGKLPHLSVAQDYALEYGIGTLEIHCDAIAAGRRVAIVDDLLATGGTALAAAKLVERLGGVVAGLLFAIELEHLGGRDVLGGYCVTSAIAC